MRILKIVIGRISLVILLGLAILCLGQTPALTGQARVERPFMAQASGTESASLVTGEVDTQGWGEGTHIGRFQLEAKGFVDWITGEAFGSGFLIAANGDQIFFQSTLKDGESILTFTGGTGRFEGATGAILSMPTSTPVITIDFETMTATLTSTYKAVGTITY